MKMDTKCLKLYLVTDSGIAAARPDGKSVGEIVLEAVKGGVTMVQLREKEMDTRSFIALAAELKKALSGTGVPLIINDRVDVALASGADGVHIGQSDMPYAMARALLGPDRIIGLSAENIEQVEAANGLDVDYIGISPVFATPTKTDTAAPFGIDGLRRAVGISEHPCVGIGGMNIACAADVMEAGADGIAVVSAIMAAPDPQGAAAELSAAVNAETMKPSAKDAPAAGPDGAPRGEFAFIEEVRKMFPAPEGVEGIGDDCAIIPQRDGMDTLVSTDMLMDGIHFLAEDISAYDLGWKSGAVNFSDVAAMGGSPVGSFLSLSLPPEKTGKWVDEFMRGYRKVSEEYGFPLLGGDTTASKDRICINVTVLGECAKGRGIRRSGARIGDMVCVTGTLGDSAAGLDVILNRSRRKDDTDEGDASGFIRTLTGKHYRPQPRMKEGRELAANAGVHAMMDISDGIGSDIRHIAEESGVGAEIDVRRIPLSDELKEFCRATGTDPVDFAVDGGEDYELLFTIDPEAEKGLKVPHTVIGRIIADKRIVWAGTSDDHKGYRHFSDENIS